MTTTSEPADLGVPPKLAPPDPSQAKAIKEKIQHYVDGLRNGDVGTLMKAFRDEAVVCGYIDTESFVQPVSYLYRFVLANKPPSASGEQYKCEITDIQAAGHRHGWVALNLKHRSGATSQASLCCRVAMESRTELELFGTSGSRLFDGREGDRREVGTNMRRAFAGVVAGTPHPADAKRGLHLQELIERAELQL